MYCGKLTEADYQSSKGLEQGTIFNQHSLEQVWLWVETRLRSHSLTEQDVLQTLKSGFLHTPTGRVLTPLFLEALERSIKPLGGLEPKRLREFAQIICELPQERWADAFGENVNFPRGRNGEGLHGYIQTQLEHSRIQRQQKIANGQLLDNDTWKALCDFTTQANGYFRENTLLTDTLAILKDFIHLRPSPEQARALMSVFVSEFIEEIENPDPDKRRRWPKSFPETVRQLYTRLLALEITDDQPRQSWLENAIAMGTQSAVAVKTAAQAMASAMELSALRFAFGTAVEPDKADPSQSLMQKLATVKSAPERLTHYFAFGTWNEPNPAPKSPLQSQSQSQLLKAMQEIEKKSSFYNEVADSGPRYTGGFWGKALYIANLLDTFGVLQIAEKVRPHLPNVPTPPSAQQGEPETFAYTQTLEQLTQSIFDALSQIEDPLKVGLQVSAIKEIDMLMRDVRVQMDVGDPPQAQPQDPLLEQPVYGSTVEARPATTFWEGMAPIMYGALTRLSETLAVSGSYALGKAYAGAVLARENPGKTTAIVVTGVTLTALCALHEKLTELFAGPSSTTVKPDNALPATETAAQHQEHLEDELEAIIGVRTAPNQPPLLQTILERMYQSTEHNLLDDAHLIGEVAQLLRQHSLQSPQKTFVELIQELPIDAHTLKTANSIPAAEPTASRRVKRDTEYASADFDLDSMQGDAPAIAPDVEVEETESEKQARLTDYLKVLDELQTAATDTEELNENEGPADDATGAARLVVRVLRKRREALWMDASRAAGDRQLVERYANALTHYAEGKVSYSAATVAIPMHSTFGQCWLNFVSAIKNPFFIDWARQANLDLATVKIRTADNTLIGKVKGVETTFTLNDDSGWARVAGPILRTIGIVDPTYIGVSYPTGSSVPLALVSGFHGERSAPDPSQARQRALELAADPAFTQIEPDDPIRPQESRSEAQVEKQRQRLGDLYTHHALITALTGLINDKADDTPVNLNISTLAAHKDSLFAIKHPQEARRMVTAQRFISTMGWNVPKTVGEIRNLIKVLSFTLPESAERADYKGALSYERPLTSVHIQTIRETVQRFEKPVAGGLLNTLLQFKSVTSPEQGLNVALNSDNAIQLGKSLESNLNAITTPRSETEWVMAALLLDLDPTPGLPRNHVAGYNLTQAANWGAKPSTVVSGLEAHLLAAGKVSATAAPVAAYHLLSAFAPEFLVRDMPDNLVCGSHTWTSFRIAVARIEQIDPGAALRMTFEQVMNYGSTDPITPGQEIAAQSASVDPLIDWAIANGVLVANATDTYTTGQLDIAKEKFNNVRTQMALARDSLTADMPTREGLALAELERVFGKGLPYEDLCLRRKSIPHGVQASMYSLLDLYITGQLKPEIWSSYNAQIPIHTFEKNFKQLKPVESLFKETFTTYFDNLRGGSESVFKYLMSQLPMEDRQSLEYGSQKFYSVRSAIDEDRYSQTPEKIEAHKGRHGILIRSEYKGKITYYEVFPGSVEIRKNTKLPIDLKLNGELKTFRGINYSSGGIEKQCATPQPLDWDAYEKGSAPRSDVTSDVIIEEITPITQQATFYPAGYNFDRVPDAFSPSSRVDYLAKVVVDEHFVVGREQLESLARGSTNSEDEKAFKTKILNFFASLVPFKSCIDNISQGNVGSAVFDSVLDAAGFVIPGGVAAGQAVKVAKAAGKFVPKALKMTWIMSSSLVSSANPLDGVGDLLKFGKNVVCKLGTTAYRAAGIGIDQIKSLYGTTKAIDHAQLLKRADIAEGVVSAGLPGQTNPVTALFKDGKWYAFDAVRNRPYGPSLENFRPADSIPLESTIFADGSTAFTPSRVFETEPLTIRRTSGVDVVAGDKVYRFDPEHPQVLDDITSPAYFKELEGFDAVCSRGGKSKRTLQCFSKTIDNSLRDTDKLRIQAIEHKRLYPTIPPKGVAPRVIHERRIYKCDATIQKCNPDELTFPLQFRDTTSGSVISNEYFGFPNRLSDNKINTETRVVKINGIVQGVDDAREVRAILVDIPGLIYGKKTYLVAEADTGLFYYCHYDEKTTNNIEFKLISLSDKNLGAKLIKEHQNIKNPYLHAAGTVYNNDFIALPTLDYLYDSLKQLGWTNDDLNKLKEITKELSDIQKRELIITAVNRGGNADIEVIIPAIKIEPISTPPLFDTFTDHHKNQHFATQAKTQVDNQITATGLGPFNQKIANDPNDVQRQALTQPLVLWQYSNKTPGSYQLLLKTGAGNCDQMAAVAAHIILESGGSASVWRMPGAHTFTVVGIPQRETVASSIDFREPEFSNAWVVDPWANINCPASEYMEKLKDRMAQWSVEGRQIIATDWKANPPVTRWMDPMDDAWIEKVIKGPKEPFGKKTP